MYSYENPSDRISTVQINSELQHAQLELLSAHCAVHQLRLRYSTDDLARFGRRDIIRKSAQAASALNEFYSAITNKIPGPAGAFEPYPTLSTEQIGQAVNQLGAYLRAERERHFLASRPLSNEEKARMWPYFSAPLLDRVRIVELQGARVTAPEFLAQARALGFENLPELSHADSLTFLDVVVFNEGLTERALFHGLVHVVQKDVLGLERYAELWIQGFLKTRAHFTVPLEVHAYSLASKFLRVAPERFSVEEQVVRWVADDRY